MKKADMIAYLQWELAELKSNMEVKKAECTAATDEDCKIKADSYEIAQRKYYYLWMLCNDMGITQ